MRSLQPTFVGHTAAPARGQRACSAALFLASRRRKDETRWLCPCGWPDSGIPSLVSIFVFQTLCTQRRRECVKPRSLRSGRRVELDHPGLTFCRPCSFSHGSRLRFPLLIAQCLRDFPLCWTGSVPPLFQAHQLMRRRGDVLDVQSVPWRLKQRSELRTPLCPVQHPLVSAGTQDPQRLTQGSF